MFAMAWSNQRFRTTTTRLPRCCLRVMDRGSANVAGPMPPPPNERRMDRAPADVTSLDDRDGIDLKN